MILRIDATKEFVNAIGGIDVVVKSSDCLRYKTGCTGETLDYDDTWGHLHIHLKEGMQHLNGEQAVAYMRFRHDWCSDPCRIMRQQQVLHAMVDKLKGDQVNTLLHLGDLLRVFRSTYRPTSPIRNCSRSPRTIREFPITAIVNAQVPYTDDVDLPGYGDSLVPDTGARAKLVGEMLVRAAAPRSFARRDRAGGDSRRPRCALTSRTAAASRAPRDRVAAASAEGAASPSATSATRIAPTTRRPRSTNIPP